MQNKIGIVIIGRNEADNLSQCLLAVKKRVTNIVYVDSGSTDNSIQLARSLEIDVIELDSSLPFTAARGRNAGFTYLLQQNNSLQYIQFIDGDCFLIEGWLEKAQNVLENQLSVAVVCGIQKEIFPDNSIYNRLRNIEWTQPIGETKACTGNAMMRVKAFREIQGFNITLIAGEEPELCLRLRQKGWKIIRLDIKMVLHDANITKFSQWWKRNIRTGYAYANGAWLHGKTSEKFYVKETLSIWFWSLFVPLLSLILIFFTHGISLLIPFILYSILLYRIYNYMEKRGFSETDSWLYARFCLLGKFPELVGQIKFLTNNIFKLIDCVSTKD